MPEVSDPARGYSGGAGNAETGDDSPDAEVAGLYAAGVGPNASDIAGIVHAEDVGAGATGPIELGLSGTVVEEAVRDLCNEAAANDA